MRVSANGGTPEALIKAKVPLLRYPQILPDGEIGAVYTAGIEHLRR